MKLLNHAKSLKNFKEDPFGFLIDSFIRVLANLFIPVPLSGGLLVQLRGPILGLILGFTALGVFLLITVATLLFSPLFISANFLESLLPTTEIATNANFSQSSIPSQNPLGGQGMEYTTITAGFMDPQYYLQFGKNHTGIDLVPNDTYYKNSPSYQESHRVVVFATHTGKARFYVDSEGGETVEVTNDDQTLKTIYIHFKSVLVKTGDTIKAGQALGEMGKTGFATGEHVHYEIRIKDANTWLAVNPLSYIK